jgi:hypothetical protein
MVRATVVMILLGFTRADAQPAPEGAGSGTSSGPTQPLASTPSPSEVEQARVHFEQGVALFNDADYAAALAEFTESYRARPLVFVVYNIGLTQKALFRYGEAVESLHRFLAESSSLTPEQRAQTEKIIAEIEALLAAVTVDAAPEGAAIAIDGRPMGISPLPKPLQLAAGIHTIEVIADGYQSQKKEFMVSARVPLTLKFGLQAIPSTGKVRIETSVTRARITVDGRDLGGAPVEIELVPGGHTLEVVAPRYVTHREELVVAAGQVRSVDVRLERVREPRWYQQWYVWTPIALVVAGSVGAGIAFGTHEGPIAGTLAPGAGKIQ